MVNKVLRETTALAVIIRKAIADIKSGGNIDPTALATLTAAQAPLAKLQQDIMRNLYVLCGFCFAIVAVIITVRPSLPPCENFADHLLAAQCL